MHGFSFEQMLVLATVCILVLGPKKSLELANLLGRKAGALKRMWNDCRRQIELPQSALKTGQGLKEEFAKSSGELSKELKEAVRVNKNGEESFQTVSRVHISDPALQMQDVKIQDLIKRLDGLERELAELKANQGESGKSREDRHESSVS